MKNIKKYHFNTEKPIVILLNGTSSSGKSTLSMSLKYYFEETTNIEYEIISIDDFLAMSPDEVIYEDDVYEISSDMNRAILAVMKEQKNVIIDHVITSKRIFSQLIHSLREDNIFLIQVTAPLHELKRREKLRGNRPPGNAEAALKYLFPANIYDLKIDTFSLSTEECIYRVETLLSQKPQAVQKALKLTDGDLSV